MNQDVFDVKKRHSDALFRLPNVVGLGVGNKVVDNKPTPDISIKVYVSSKVERNQLSTKELVPEKLDGYPTDVEEKKVTSKLQW
ncbi:MAG: hypothetical protein ACI9S8_000945 [Chlamydiales bacterium]|jgi:hypothetical protein